MSSTRSTSDFHQRRDHYLGAVRDYMRPLLDAEANWTIDLTRRAGRLDIQLATAFYYGDAADVALANRLTRRAPVSEFNGHRFNIFQTSIACHHLVVFRDRLEPETVAWCREVIAEGCEPLPGMGAADYQFHGYNDNMPAMAVKTLILGGELLGRQDLFEVGRWKLRRFAELLGRHGLISEYNSPNYTPDTIHNLTTVAIHAADPEMRRLAAKIVRRVWLDLAAHWHPHGRCPAGPFSRAYRTDFNNHVSSLNAVVWMLFGDEVAPVSAMESFQPRSGIEPMHCNDPLEHTARMAWYASLDDSLLDDDTAALFLRKDDPFEVIATALQGDSTASPLRKTTATSHLTGSGTLGSAAYSFFGGEQTAAVYATGCARPVSPLVYSRFLVDDVIPGATATDDWHHLTTGEPEISSRATSVTVQKERSLLASYVPHRVLGEAEALRLVLIAPRSLGQFDGFLDADGQPLPLDQPLSSEAWYGARLGSALLAVRPLAFDALGLPAPQVVARRNDRYDLLEIVSYRGPKRAFTPSELAAVCNGFALELAAAADWPSPAAFLQALTGASAFEDQFLFRTRRLQYRRAALADRPAAGLTLNYSTAADGVAERIIDGQLAPEPAWQCTGIPAESLPLMGSDRYEAPLGLPWSNLSVFRFDDPWAIHLGGES